MHRDLRGFKRFAPIVIVVGHSFQVMGVVILKSIIGTIIMKTILVLLDPVRLPIAVEVNDGSGSLYPEGEHRVHL